MTKALDNNFNILRLKPVLVEPNLHYVQEYNVQEKTAALESAKEYLEYDPSDRDRDIAITVVKQVRNSVEITILNLLLVIVFQFLTIRTILPCRATSHPILLGSSVPGTESCSRLVNSVSFQCEFWSRTEH